MKYVIALWFAACFFFASNAQVFPCLERALSFQDMHKKNMDEVSSLMCEHKSSARGPEILVYTDESDGIIVNTMFSFRGNKCTHLHIVMVCGYKDGNCEEEMGKLIGVLDRSYDNGFELASVGSYFTASGNIPSTAYASQTEDHTDILMESNDVIKLLRLYHR